MLIFIITGQEISLIGVCTTPLFINNTYLYIYLKVYSVFLVFFIQGGSIWIKKSQIKNCLGFKNLKRSYNFIIYK